MNDILDGKTQPTVWSPGSDLGVTRINQAWSDRTGQNLIKSECPATIRTPLAIAMWEPMARAMGWPDAPINWNDLAALSNTPEGWGAYGHPEWGQGMWKGDLAIGSESFDPRQLDMLDRSNIHVQQVVRASDGTRTGVGVLEQICIGPYAPSGFKSFLDGAP